MHNNINDTSIDGNSKKLPIIASVVIVLCIVSSIFYLKQIPSGKMIQYGIHLKFGEINTYYEQVSITRFDKIMLKNDKGEKLTEICDSNINWYKLNNSSNIKYLIQNNGNEWTKWKFINYHIEEGSNVDIQWLMNNIFSINSESDIINIAIDDEVYELNENQKKKLYNYMLSLKYPQTDEELSLLEQMSVNCSELKKMNINAKNGNINFIIDQNQNLLKLDEEIYSFFTIMSDNEFSDIR